MVLFGKKWGKVVDKYTKVGESGDIVFLVDPECGLPSTAAIHGKSKPHKGLRG
jgi:hypothetical protein